MAFKIYELSGFGDSWKKYIQSRLTGTKHLQTNSSGSEGSNSENTWDHHNGWSEDPGSADYFSYMFKRAPSYFDVVAYTGASGNQTINHNLGVVPEMIWIKKRSESSYYGWPVYWGTTGNLYLNQNYYSGYASSNAVNHSNISATTFEVKNGNTDVNDAGETHIAYLFATVAGVSKVGSYTGNGGTQNIDCGFSSGARFVLIKKTSDTGHWVLFDTVRGIVAGNDARLKLNNTDAESSSYDDIDPLSSGFTLNNVPLCNTDGASYIFYAIA
tara:strand:- start:1335 stop:2147 length:813 start_codon:yes stop_codon:yes gene_type:complete